MGDGKVRPLGTEGIRSPFFGGGWGGCGWGVGVNEDEVGGMWLWVYDGSGESAEGLRDVYSEALGVWKRPRRGLGAEGAVRLCGSLLWSRRRRAGAAFTRGGRSLGLGKVGQLEFSRRLERVEK